MELGRELPEGMLDDRLIRLGINQCCTLVYTSDSTGPTKGVMLSHDNLTWCSKMVRHFKLVLTLLLLTLATIKKSPIKSPRQYNLAEMNSQDLKLDLDSKYFCAQIIAT